jgi:hypothetical protein
MNWNDMERNYFSGDNQVIEKNGGASRDRTDDLIVANDALSQLSYSPTCEGTAKQPKRFYQLFATLAQLPYRSLAHARWLNNPTLSTPILPL